MSSKNVIILSNEPRGRFIEGIVDGTPVPGNIMQIKAATEPVGGRHTWLLAAPGTDFLKVLFAIALEDALQGKLVTDAYVTGKRIFLYVPIPGEEVNVICGEVAGTGNTYAIGDRLAINATGGYLIPDGGGVKHTMAVVMETVTQVASAHLTHVMVV